MALRYAINIDNAALLRVEPDKVVPRFSAPGSVEFRPGANIAGVVEELMVYDRVKLCAAVGAGKSVKVPEALAKATGRLVVHCVPSPHLALNLHRYVSTQVSVPTAFVEGGTADLPKKGLAFTSSADLVRRVLEWRGKGFEPPPFVLFLDECHESDCFTEVLRTLGSSLPGVSNLVLSSATFDPDGFRRVEAAGARRDQILPDMVVDDWDPEDDGKPWSLSNLDNDAMINIEKLSVRDKMYAAYKENGFLVYNLTSRMPISEFSAVLDMLACKNRPVMVLLVDYSFRSGHTFPTMMNFIDSGMVKYYGKVDGQPAQLFRKAYKFEVEQFAGRGARVPGSRAVCWLPPKPETKMCDLEGTEVDAAALLYRMLGYKPPRSYNSSPFYEGRVPDDIRAAFLGKMPLFMWGPERLTDWVGGCVQPAEPDIPCVPVYRPAPIAAQRPNFKVRSSIDGVERPFTPPSPDLIPVAPMKRVSSPVPAMRPRISTITGEYTAEMAEAFELSATPVAMNSAASLPRVFKESHDRGVVAEVDVSDSITNLILGLKIETSPDMPLGEYRYYPGIERCADGGMHHAGVDSVHRLVRKPTVVDGLDYGERLSAVKVLLDEYNDAVARLKAIKRISVSLPQVSQMMGNLVDPGLMRVWAEGLNERLIEDKASIKTYGDDMLCLFSVGYTAVSGPMADAFEGREVEYVNAYLRQLETVVSDHDPSGQDNYAQKVREKPKSGVLLGSVRQKLIMPSERTRASRELREIEPARTRDLVRSKPVQGRSVAKYRLQPQSGLPSFIARTLIKAVGEGDVKMEVEMV